MRFLGHLQYPAQPATGLNVVEEVSLGQSPEQECPASHHLAQAVMCPETDCGERENGFLIPAKVSLLC